MKRSIKKVLSNIKSSTKKSEEIELGKIHDNRSLITIKNTYLLCSYCSFNDQSNKPNMISTIENNEDLLVHSNVVIVIKAFENIKDSLIEFLSNKNELKTEVVLKDNEYTIIIGGSIFDYKDMIKSIQDTNNNILQLVIDSLYQLDYRFFKDLINDEIMIKDRFVYECEDEYLNKINDDISIFHIDNILDLWSSVDGIIPMRRLPKFINVTLHLKNIPYIDICNINKCTYSFDNSFIPMIKKKVEWAGNEWDLNSLAKAVMSVQESISDNTISDLYRPLGNTVDCYITYTLEEILLNIDSYSSIKESIFKYITDNFGEDFDIDNLLLPEYKQKIVCNDEKEFIDEVVDEHIMTNEEYLELYLEQQEDKDLQDE
jgi:hypothetical protein